jgi:phage gpG-like protein
MELALDIHDRELRATVERFEKALNDWSGAWAEVAEAVRTAVLWRFESAGGGTWPPLSPRYAARKARQHPGQPLMRATDRLFESLAGGSPESVVEGSPRRLAFGTAVPYAVYGESEAPRSGRVPRRAIFDFARDGSEEEREALAQPWRAWARRLASDSGWSLAARGPDRVG